MSSLLNASSLQYSDGKNARPSYWGLTLEGWISVTVVTFLMAATFRFNLIRLWAKTNPYSGEPEWGHSIVVPLIGLYYLFIHRDELLATKVEPLLVRKFGKGRVWGAGALAAIAGLMYLVGPRIVESQAAQMQTGGMFLGILAVLVIALDWGLAMTVFGLLFFTYGIYPGQNDYFKDLGMVCTLFGVVLTLSGWKVMRIAWFPIVFLICALPWPGSVYSWVAGPLQVLAAKVAVAVLNFCGVPSFQFGTKINMGTQVLNVAEACAGLKSLMTFVTLGAAMAFLSSKPLWQKLFMVAMAVPIAISCNVMRVSGQGLLDHFAGHAWSENFAHQFVGMVMLAPAFVMLLALGWILDRLFVEDDDVEVSRAATAAAGVRAPAAPDVLIAPIPTRTAPRPPTVSGAAAKTVSEPAQGFIPPARTARPAVAKHGNVPPAGGFVPPAAGSQTGVGHE